MSRATPSLRIVPVTFKTANDFVRRLHRHSKPVVGAKFCLALGRVNPSAATPIRVQLSRKKGWKMPENTVSVARPGLWGNPFRIGGYFTVGGPVVVGGLRMSWCEATPEAAGPGYTYVGTAQIAVDMFRLLLAHGYHKDFSDLRGKNLACWCKEGPCHADVLLEIANK